MSETQSEQVGRQVISRHEELGLAETFTILWQGKWWVVALTMVSAIASAAYALSLPDKYTATAVVASAAAAKNSSLSQLGARIGGIASLAGINFGAEDTSDDVIAMQIARSWEFADLFAKKHNLYVSILASEGWDPKTNTLLLDDSVYDSVQKKWIPDAYLIDETGQPSSWELYKVFRDNFAISQEKGTGLINIRFTHFSPHIARQVTNSVIRDINDLMRERALADTSKNIKYLSEQIEKTAFAEMKSVFYSLIEEQLKTLMLAEGSDEYVFRTVSKAMLPEVRSQPNRAVMVIAVTVVGFIFSVMLVLIRYQVKK